MGRFTRIGALATLAIAAALPALPALAQSPSPSPAASPSVSASPSTASPAPSASASPSATPAASPSASPTAAPSATPSPTPTVAPDGDLGLRFTSAARLIQVGGRFTYRFTISNDGSAPLTNVEIHQLVPPELDVLGVPILDEVDYTQLGRVGNVNEDILWGINTLGPGERITLSWFARVSRSGDHIATGSISATVQELDDVEVTPPPVYVASADLVGIVKEGRSSVTTTETRTRPVTGPGSLGAPGAILPATGFSEGDFALLGVGLVALGLGLWRLRNRRAVLNSIVIAGLLLSACTSDPEIEPEVKGQRIENTTPGDDASDPADGGESDESPDDDGSGNGDGTGGGNVDAGAPDIAAPDVSTGAPDVGAAPIEFVTEEVTVEVPANELATSTLGATASSNQIALEWSGSDGLVAARSGVTFFPEAVAEMLTSLRDRGNELTVGVTLQNLMDDRNLVVRGRFVHEVAGLSGGTVSLTSAPIDVTLAPGAITEQRFTYKLPTGSYSLDSRFVPQGG